MRILSHPNNILTQSRCGQKPDRPPPQQSDMQLLIGTPPCCYCGEVKESLFHLPYLCSSQRLSKGGGWGGGGLAAASSPPALMRNLAGPGSDIPACFTTLARLTAHHPAACKDGLHRFRPAFRCRRTYGREDKAGWGGRKEDNRPHTDWREQRTPL